MKIVANGTEIPFPAAGTEIVQANGLEFSIRKKGDPENPAIILLHGFPEASIIWSNLLEDLSRNGYFVVAPDQRGYSPGARPSSTESYLIDSLAADVLAITKALDIERFHLVGHDWGSAVGWLLASQAEDRILSYTSLAVPHIDALSHAYQNDTVQYEASNYVRFFQRRLLPEYMIARNDYAALRAIWSEHNAKEVESLVKLVKQKGALTSIINWYRANFKMFSEGRSIGPINVSTVYIWGNQDMALKRSGAELTKNHVYAYYRFVELDAGHWLIQQSYDRVLEEILNHVLLVQPPQMNSD